MKIFNAVLENPNLQEQVRDGILPHHPDILESYLKNSELPSAYPKKFAKLSGRKALNTLIETIRDDLFPKHWKQHCLNNLYHPLSYL